MVMQANERPSSVLIFPLLFVSHLDEQCSVLNLPELSLFVFSLSCSCSFFPLCNRWINHPRGSASMPYGEQTVLHLFWTGFEEGSLHLLPIFIEKKSHPKNSKKRSEPRREPRPQSDLSEGPNRTAGFPDASASGERQGPDKAYGNLALRRRKGPLAPIFVLGLAGVVQKRRSPAVPGLGLIFGRSCVWAPGPFGASQRITDYPTFQMISG